MRRTIPSLNPKDFQTLNAYKRAREQSCAALEQRKIWEAYNSSIMDTEGPGDNWFGFRSY